ncbi:MULTISPECIES: type II secretion system protein N [Candidatus Ichthyocystis]|uniref:Putative Type 4 fimbrial protein PilP n=1 Tax=Candidatus Ichthyocystis hellenicum TaxID=1561003 RepID=A0A0S4M095_9BURK|nr:MULTISPECIES: type II secretion system protein N [Ichthyocystis]CUT17223.1 putative Type 4 fimbrial protein PilP [Candidatus Ichthyocystis hellenicum]
MVFLGELINKFPDSRVAFVFSKFVSVMVDMSFVLAAVVFVVFLAQGVLFSSASGDFSFYRTDSAYTGVSLFGNLPVVDELTPASPRFKLLGTLMSSDGHSVAIVGSGQSVDDLSTFVVKVGGTLPDGSVLKSVDVDHVIVSNHGKVLRLDSVRYDQDLVRTSHMG